MSSSSSGVHPMSGGSGYHSARHLPCLGPFASTSNAVRAGVLRPLTDGSRHVSALLTFTRRDDGSASFGDARRSAYSLETGFYFPSTSYGEETLRWLNCRRTCGIFFHPSTSLLPLARRLCFRCGLCVCQLDYSMTTSRIFMKLGGGVYHGPRKNQLNVWSGSESPGKYTHYF